MLCNLHHKSNFLKILVSLKLKSRLNDLIEINNSEILLWVDHTCSSISSTVTKTTRPFGLKGIINKPFFLVWIDTHISTICRKEDYLVFVNWCKIKRFRDCYYRLPNPTLMFKLESWKLRSLWNRLIVSNVRPCYYQLQFDYEIYTNCICFRSFGSRRPCLHFPPTYCLFEKINNVIPHSGQPEKSSRNDTGKQPR